MRIERVENPGHDVEDAIMDALIAHNVQAAGPHRYLPLALVVRSPEGAITGGLWAELYYDWCFIKLLVLPDSARGQGIGTALMHQAEAAARDYGAIGLWLDTFSFQARGFYEKLGFSPFGTIDDYPRGGTRFFMQKRF